MKRQMFVIACAAALATGGALAQAPAPDQGDNGQPRQHPDRQRPHSEKHMGQHQGNGTNENWREKVHQRMGECGTNENWRAKMHQRAGEGGTNENWRAKMHQRMDERGDRHPGMGGGPGEVLRKLNLTPEQQARVTAVFEKRMEQNRPTREKAEALRNQLREQMESGDPDPQKIRALHQQLATLEGDMVVSHVEAMKEIKGILTPDQQAEFQKDVSARRGQMEQRRKEFEQRREEWQQKRGEGGKPPEGGTPPAAPAPATNSTSSI